MQIKTPQNVLVLGLTILMSTACSKLSFVGEPVACETPGSSTKYGLNGPVILYPTVDSVVGGKVRVSGSCVSDQAVEIKEASSGQTTKVDCKDGAFSSEITLSAGDGSKDLLVSQNTAADGSEVVDRLCFMKDTTPPAVTISNGNSAQSTNSPTSVLSGTCESGLTVILAGPGLKEPVTTECTNGSFSISVQMAQGDGVKDIQGTQIDRAGNQGRASTSVQIDTLPPEVRITSNIPTVTNLSSLLVSGVCETGLPVQIGELHNTTAPSVLCAGGTFTATIPLVGADGPVAARVFQVDTAGNIGFDSKDLLKDTLAPALTISSPLADSYLKSPGTFTGTCETGLFVDLSGDVVATPRQVPCVSGQWSLTGPIASGDGKKTLIAAQTDAAGNKTEIQRSFQVDTTAPVLAITSPAENSPVASTFPLSGTCESGLMVQIGGAGLLPATSAACTNGSFSAQVTVSPLDGTKAVTISQTDAAGNTGSASRNFLRDTLAPVLTITSPAQNTYVSATLTLTGACEAGLKVELSGAGLAAPAAVTCAANGTYSANLSLSAGDGSKAITAKETDGAGNSSTANATYLRDTTAPVVAFTSPAANSVGQTGITVSGICETGLNVTLSGSGVASPVVTSCDNGLFNAALTFSAGEGSKQVTASQTDKVGNTGTASRDFVSDLKPPTITITSPAANSYLPATFAVQGACETGPSVLVGGPGVASEVTVPCASGTYSANVTVSAGDGVKTVTAKQTDSVGNSATVSRDFLRDTQGPLLTITSPANGATAQNGLQITGTCEKGLTVNISGSGVSAPSSVVCSPAGTYQADLNFSAGDGPKTITVSETDGAGNTTQITGNFNRDLTPPAIAITSPAANTLAKNGLTVGGTCETGPNVTLGGAGVANAVTTACTNGAFSAAVDFSAGSGVKTVTATQTDAYGNSASDTRNFLRDITAPAVTITSPVANSYVPASFPVQGACEAGLPVVLGGAGLASSVTTDCNGGTYSATVTASSGDGTKNITVQQTDGAGNVGQASQNYLRDTQPPVLSITSPANGATAQNGIQITGACESGLTVNFSGSGIAAPSSVVCAANGTYQASLSFSAGDGPKAISVSETDAAGNTAQVTGTFNRDLTPPAIAITTPDANTAGKNGLTVGGTCESGLNVILNGAGVATPVTTACTNGAFSAAIGFSAGSGAKAVTATQTDAYGNSASDTRNFVRDLTAPVLTFTSPAANSYVDASFNVQGTCEAGLSVQIDGAGVLPPTSTPCANGTFEALVWASPLDGTKAVTVSQTDLVGNVGSASRNFLRDTLAPLLSIDSPAQNSFVNATLTLAGTCEAGLKVEFSGAGLAAASSVVCASNGTYSTNLSLSAGDGSKAITAKETDGAGNSSTANATYLRDTTAPAIAITSPAANTVAQNGLTVGGTCESGLNVTLGGTGVASAVVTSCDNGAFSAAISFSNGSGSKQVTASQKDAAGNTGSASRDFVRDLTPPTITITAPAANSYLPTTFTVQGACETGLPVELGGAGLASPVTAACAAGTYSASVSVSAGDGVKTVTAKQSDSVGNSATASRDFLRDTQPPVLSITSPANGTTAQNGLQITGACESGLTVNFSGSGVAAPSSVVCAANGTYQASLSFSAGDGAKAVSVSETDAAGNSSQANGTFNRDLTAPVVAIMSPDANTSAQNGLTVGGTCETGLNVTLYGPGVATPVYTACNNGGFSAALSFSSGSGSKVVYAAQTDAVGNVGTASRTFVRDLTAPVVTITSPAAGSYLADSITVQGACESGLQVVLSGAGLATGASVPCTNGAYSSAVSISSGDGSKVITAQQTDTAGNVGQTSQTYLRDATAPVLAITSPVAGSSVPTSVTLTGTCETGLSVSVSGDLTGTSGSCVAGAFSIPVTFTAGLGTKNVQVQQKDAAGNTGQATSQFLRDSNSGSETFISDASFGKIDILFVDDNSASMDPNQASLGAKFSGFATELLNIDWQIGITTTDCSTGPYGICGSLLPLTGYNSTILTPTVPSYQTVFNNSIRRPETAGCLNTGTCPSGNSEPLLAATTAMNKYNSVNNGFFRANADLAIVILSDADERQVGGSNYANRPAELVAAFNTIWPSGKKLKVYSIIVKPGDSACLSTMKAGSGGFSFYGDLIDQTVNLTSGLSTSICAPDYSIPLKGIGESVRTLTNSVELAHTPVANSVTVQFTPNQNITYKVIGNKVVFDSPPSVGTEIKVNYQY